MLINRPKGLLLVYLLGFLSLTINMVTISRAFVTHKSINMAPHYSTSRGGIKSLMLLTSSCDIGETPSTSPYHYRNCRGIGGMDRKRSRCDHLIDRWFRRSNFKLKMTSSSRSADIENSFMRGKRIKFALLGGGAFSLALSKVLSYKNISTTMLVRNQTVADYINEKHYHPKYLPESLLPMQLYATSDPAEALSDATFVIHAVPMQQSREFLENMKPYLSPNIPILSVTKGVEQTTFCLMNDIISQTLGQEQKAAFLSGPSFAKEIMNGEATAVVIASTDDALSSELAEILSSEEFRCHTSRDVKVPTINLCVYVYVDKC